MHAPPAARRLRIAAVVPALDEAPSIAGVVTDLIGHPLIDRVIVVDNGSRDGTGEIARRAGATVVREERRGYGSACRAGVRAATGADVVVLLDADGADDPADLDAVIGALLGGEADLVVGSRVLGTAERGALAPAQRAGNRLATALMRARFGMRVTDLGPLRAIRRADLLALEMTELTYGWSAQMVVLARRAGLRYREVPVRYRRRIGVSKVSGTVRGRLGAGWCILRAVARPGT